MTTGERIRQLRKERGMTQEELASRIGVKRPAVNKYETGAIVNLKRDIIEKISDVFDVSPSYIMCLDDVTTASNLMPLKPMDKIPLVGRIACGTPILAEENIEEYIDLPTHITATFALICKGDSMIRAGIQDGDVVYIRKQPDVENGQIAAVIIDGGEATLKRVYHSERAVTLVAENPAVPPFIFEGNDIERLRIAGIAVAFTHALV